MKKTLIAKVLIQKCKIPITDSKHKSINMSRCYVGGKFIKDEDRKKQSKKYKEVSLESIIKESLSNQINNCRIEVRRNDI